MFRNITRSVVKTLASVAARRAKARRSRILRAKVRRVVSVCTLGLVKG